MASLSLPRVLQPRKTSLEIEREQFEKAQSIAIQKAISREETAVKQKHVRSAIIGTFHHQGGDVFWSIAVRLPYMEDMIVAWKFCYVLHKVLREGHPLCVVHSMRHRGLLDQIGKLWGHLDGYGKLIKQYTYLLITKLEFHNRNPKFPNNLALTTDELRSICGGNADICFQLSVEIFDYLDCILELQKSIYSSPASSMTMQGQCRLAAIIPCIQDASRLYDHNVKILYTLHSMVDYDALEGHRHRFGQQYKLMKKFYDHTNNLQYFKNLISIPLLSDQPNFKANFNTYVTQEVYVPQEVVEPEEEAANLIDVNLIDTSDAASALPDVVDTVPPIPPKPSSHFIEAPPPPQIDIIVERDNIIKSLHENIALLRAEVKTLNDDKIEQGRGYQTQIGQLQNQLVCAEEELVRVNEMHSANDPKEVEKIKLDKEKIQASYKQVRTEHINLLRDKAKIEKSLKIAEKSLAESQAKNTEIEEQLASTEQKIEALELQLRAAQETSAKLESLKLDQQGRDDEIQALKQQIEEAQNVKDTLSHDLEEAKRQNTALEAKHNELLQVINDKEQEITQTKTDSEDKLKALLHACIESNIRIVRHAVEEVDNPALSGLICSPDYLNSLSTSCEEALSSAISSETVGIADICDIVTRIAHTHSNYIIQGRATSNTCPDISFGEKMADSCKTLGQSAAILLESMKNTTDVTKQVDTCKECLMTVRNHTEELNGYVRGHSSENLESMLEAEMQAMDKAIEDAVKQMEEMLNKSRADHSGIKLEVNERILDKCTTLMEAIRILVQKSRHLQAEIVGQGKGTVSSKEFYKRNHQWTDGFISAAKAVGASAKFLLSVADKAVATDGKLEPLVVAAQNISGSTAQLVVASRVKADRNSSNLRELSAASKNVTNSTAAIVATVKDCGKLIDETMDVDTSNLSLHNSKRLEMDSQVRVLELEKELEMERLRLSQLRKHHYQLEEEVEKQISNGNFTSAFGSIPNN